MRKSRILAAVLAAAMMTGGPAAVYAGQEALSPETQAETKAVEAESGTEEEQASGAKTDASDEDSAAVSGIRPAYRASDYVSIKDDAYKTMTLREYPPKDDSPEAQEEYQKTLDTDLMSRLYSLYPVKSFPKDLENYVVSGLISSYSQTAEMYGMDLGAFLSTYIGTDQAGFESKVRKAAEKTLKQELLLTAVAEKEGITVTDQEFQQGLADYAAKYGYESPEALLGDFDEATVRVSLLMDKVLDFLEKANKIEVIVETETEAATEAETTAVSEAAQAQAGQPAAETPAAGEAAQPAAETPAAGQAGQPAAETPAAGQAGQPAAETPAAGQAAQPAAETPAAGETAAQ